MSADATYDDEWGYRMDVIPEGIRGRAGSIYVIEGIVHFPRVERPAVADAHARCWEERTGGKATVVCRTVRRVVQYGEWSEPPEPPEPPREAP